jgi:hypothetical protein
MKNETRVHRMDERLGNSEISLREDDVGHKDNLGQTNIKTKHMFWVNLWALTVNAATKTTMHGLPGIFQAKYLLVKIMWAICLLASTGVCAYLLIKSVQDFLEYGVVTVTSNVYERPTLFPVPKT